jgi:NAD(P)-dependent dehydrogenase (short-subunit alcohol dehydrogenase family)
MNKPVVLITGALTGIGRATALAFAHDGACVVVSGRRDDDGQKLATELRNLGTDAEFVRTDVRHEDEVKNLVDKIIARFGRLDIVNVVGRWLRHLQRLGCFARPLRRVGSCPRIGSDVFNLAIGHRGQSCQDIAQVAVWLERVAATALND